MAWRLILLSFLLLFSLPVFVSAKEFYVERPSAAQITEAIASASLQTGVRATLLYGLLGQETSFGGNLGKTAAEWNNFCATRNTEDCRNWRLYDCKGDYINARHYDDILRLLGYIDNSGMPDRSKIPTSSTCALGFSQFEPNTWWLTTKARGLILSPWDINNAMLTAAYYLSELGADGSDVLAPGEIIGGADRIALQKYYCGAFYNRSECRVYARGVELRARNAEFALLNLDLSNQLAQLQGRRQELKGDVGRVAEHYAKSGRFPIILSVTDNKGAMLKQSAYNGYVGQYDTSAWPRSILRPGDTVKFTVKTKDPKDRKILYHWSSNSQVFNKRYGFDRLQNPLWREENEIEYEITRDDLSAGPAFSLTINIRAAEGEPRNVSAGNDDTITADYVLLPAGAQSAETYYTKIVSLSDNRGNFIRRSAAGAEDRQWGKLIRVGDTIRLRAEASGPKDGEIFYQWNSNSANFSKRYYFDILGNPIWRKENEIEYTVTEDDLRQAGGSLYVGVFVRSGNVYTSDPSGGTDDSVWVTYELLPTGIEKAEEYFPVILRASDNKGNIFRKDQVGTIFTEGSGRTTVKTGETIRLKVEAKDPHGRQILYRWSSNSSRFNERYQFDRLGNPLWRSENQIEYTLSEEDLRYAGPTLSIEVKIRSQKEYFRDAQSESDDSVYIIYTVEE